MERDLNRYWVVNIRQLACVKPFSKFSDRTLFRKVNEIRAFAQKPKKSNGRSEPITLADVAAYLNVSGERLAGVVDFEAFERY